MVNGAEVELVKEAVFAAPEEIIKPAAVTAEKALTVSLVKKTQPVVVPPPVYPVPTYEPAKVYIPPVPVIPTSPGKKSLVMNIETTGFKPWERRIIAIGIADPEHPEEPPVVVMEDNEARIIKSLFTVIKSLGINELIGYGNGFDYRFILLRAMKYNIDCKEFYDCDLYDVMQAMGQGKFSYIYYAPKPPSLSDIADFFWGYPKPFTDLEMLKYYAIGDLDKVREFTSSQVTRIMLVYSLFRKISESPFVIAASGSVGTTIPMSNPQGLIENSKLTIPEAHAPETVKYKCPICLAEYKVPSDQTMTICDICGNEVELMPNA